MLESEKKILEQLDKKDPMSKQWLPLRWAANIVTEARREGLIRADCLLPAILNELSAIRDKLVGIINHDGVPVPLVYTQVSTENNFLFLNERYFILIISINR